MVVKNICNKKNIKVYDKKSFGKNSRGMYLGLTFFQSTRDIRNVWYILSLILFTVRKSNNKYAIRRE